MIRGYTPGPHGLDSVIVGFYRGDDLVYVARTRNGFVPASRRRLFEKLRPLVKPDRPFVNLPETRSGRWDWKYRVKDRGALARHMFKAQGTHSAANPNGVSP